MARGEDSRGLTHTLAGTVTLAGSPHPLAGVTVGLRAAVPAQRRCELPVDTIDLGTTRTDSQGSFELGVILMGAPEDGFAQLDGTGWEIAASVDVPGLEDAPVSVRVDADRRLELELTAR